MFQEVITGCTSTTDYQADAKWSPDTIDLNKHTSLIMTSVSFMDIEPNVDLAGDESQNLI